MATLTLGDRTFPVAPFRLRQLRAAAPFIDRLAARAADGAKGVSALAETAADMLGALAVGVEGETAESLQALASLSDLAGVREAFDAAMAEAGLTAPQDGAAPSGEPTAAGAAPA